MKSIINLMKSEGVESLDFFYHRSRPRIQNGGDKYEILNIDLNDETLEITAIKVWPSYEHKLTYLTVDSTWRSTSINHLKDIVQQELNKLYE